MRIAEKRDFWKKGKDCDPWNCLSWFSEFNPFNLNCIINNLNYTQMILLLIIFIPFWQRWFSGSQHKNLQLQRFSKTWRNRSRYWKNECPFQFCPMQSRMPGPFSLYEKSSLMINLWGKNACKEGYNYNLIIINIILIKNIIKFIINLIIYHFYDNCFKIINIINNTIIKFLLIYINLY